MENLEVFFKDISPSQTFHITNSGDYTDIVSIILSLDSYFFNIFWKTDTIKQISKQYLKDELNYKLIEQMQYGILLDLTKHDADIKTIDKVIENIKNLVSLNLAHNEHCNYIIRFLQEIKTKKFQNKTLSKPKQNLEFKNFFEESIHIMQKEMDIIEKTFKNDIDLPRQFQEIILDSKTQKLKIAISGILSAGKSTLINALLGEEILGSSTIPETASLTVLKYNSYKKAEITFWNTKEFNELKKTINSENASIIESDYITQQEKEYIQEESKTIEIPLEKLKLYTSANTEEKLCNLVKQTTLYTPLEILKNNVEIVDTPGLDDPIIQREEITKQYIQECDLLLYAMNASQSATQLDIDFILHALQNTNISRILIILTHADLLEDNDLQAAFSYTKNSIEKQLLENMVHTKASLMLNRLDFIYLSSYPALVCKTDEKLALELGYSLEKSNFIALENYLDRTLIGDNSTRAKDTIFLATQKLEKILINLKNNLELESSLIFQSQQKIEETIAKIKVDQDIASKYLLELKSKLKSNQEMFKEHINISQDTLDQKLKNAKNILSRRIADDIIYDIDKNQKIQLDRLDKIISVGLWDFLVEILRETNNGINKKIEQIKSSLEDLDIKTINNISFDKSLITKCKAQIINKLTKELPRFNKNNKETIQNEISNLFNEGFIDFKHTIAIQSKTIEEKIINNFDQKLEELIEQKNKEQKEKEEILKKALTNSTNSEEAKEENIKNITQLIEILNHSIGVCLELKSQSTYNTTEVDNA